VAVSDSVRRAFRHLDDALAPHTLVVVGTAQKPSRLVAREHPAFASVRLVIGIDNGVVVVLKNNIGAEVVVWDVSEAPD
jgi:hypothetical protein